MFQNYFELVEYLTNLYQFPIFLGVLDHVRKARDCNLPHVKFFDEAYSKNWLTPMEGPKSLMVFVEYLLAMNPEQYASQEWKYSEWASTLSTDPDPDGFGKKM